MLARPQFCCPASRSLPTQSPAWPILLLASLSYIIVGALLISQSPLRAQLSYCYSCLWENNVVLLCGAIMVAAHKKNVSDLVGIGYKMPITMAFAIGSISIIGLPPMAGTWSKWFLILGALEADKLFIVGILLISSLLNIAYLLTIPIKAFFIPAVQNEKPMPFFLVRRKRGTNTLLDCYLRYCHRLYHHIFLSGFFLELVNLIPRSL